MARDIRPSDHGLSFESPVAVVSPQTKSFFAGSSSDTVALPEAQDSNNFPNFPVTEVRHSEQRSTMGKTGNILLVTSLVCGALGLCFIVAAGYVYMVRK
ncbi:hypothetical protein AMTR_s00155p00059880 [Amborella trichopoda]|uniref:Uncharacterized protein n=1 Tax=Amborella trichopoda TaxID=13333 RepID=W1PCP9_AMBTC|nr:hypothetical protein AMTR_s00155p00059880 [Amborella trichopoda]